MKCAASAQAIFYKTQTNLISILEFHVAANKTIGGPRPNPRSMFTLACSQHLDKPKKMFSAAIVQAIFYKKILSRFLSCTLPLTTRLNPCSFFIPPCSQQIDLPKKIFRVLIILATTKTQEICCCSLVHSDRYISSGT